jgi:hypothetical protein
MDDGMIKTLFFILVFVVASTVQAEPSKITKYLINEPISLMDFGLYKLAEATEFNLKMIFSGKDFHSRSNAYYNYDADKIELDITVYSDEYFFKKYETTEKLKNYCKKAIIEVKNMWIENNRFDSASYYFSHWKYSKSNAPGIEEIEKEVARRFKVAVTVVFRVPETKKLSCFNEGLNDQIYFSE